MCILIFSASKTKQIWTEEQDDELRQLYDQHKDAKLDGKIKYLTDMPYLYNADYCV